MRNTIYIGSLTAPSYKFDNDSTFTAKISQKVALVGQTMSYDTLTIEVADDYSNVVKIYGFRSSDGHEIVSGLGEKFCVDVGNTFAESGLLDVGYGTPVWYYNDDDLVGKFYLDVVTREGKNLYKIECVSAIGLLDKLQHGGGMYQQSTFGAVLRHILASGLHGSGRSVIQYEIDDDVAEIPVSGWLPYATKRENLYQLIFAYGVNIVKNIDGNPRFTFVYSATDAPEEISEDIIFQDGGVTYEKAYSSVSVTEHSFLAVEEETVATLFDNTDGESVSNQEIWFSQAPIIRSTLSVTGDMTIISSTVNSAVVSGRGKLTGVPYTHSKRIVSATNASAAEEKIIDVTDCTMVNAINSDNLLNRLYAFFCPGDKIKLIKGSFQKTTERCGKAYRFKNNFGEEEIAYLSSLELTASSFLRANAEFYANYEPAGQAGLYSHVDIIVPTWDEINQRFIYTGAWTVPDNVERIKIVMIGGGTGGYSGYPGENGKDAYAHMFVSQDADISSMWYGAEGGNGGKGGKGGKPGRVRIVTVDDVHPGEIIDYTLGSGGEGGAATGFIKDTREELRRALRNENPDVEYTDAQIDEMISQENTSWSGTPNVGSNGTETSIVFRSEGFNTGDSDSFEPDGGIYEPINSKFFALDGKKGIDGGKGGARRIEQNGTANWLTDGESVTGPDGTLYRGGRTGLPMSSIEGLPDAMLTVCGGNGAGAAVGLDCSEYEYMNGASDQSASWEVVESG